MAKTASLLEPAESLQGTLIEGVEVGPFTERTTSATREMLSIPPAGGMLGPAHVLTDRQRRILQVIAGGKESSFANLRA